jgi:hypothetical protein
LWSRASHDLHGAPNHSGLRGRRGGILEDTSPRWVLAWQPGRGRPVANFLAASRLASIATTGNVLSDSGLSPGPARPSRFSVRRCSAPWSNGHIPVPTTRHFSAPHSRHCFTSIGSRCRCSHAEGPRSNPAPDIRNDTHAGMVLHMPRQRDPKLRTRAAGAPGSALLADAPRMHSIGER